jgi:hypothetical protein
LFSSGELQSLSLFQVQILWSIIEPGIKSCYYACIFCGRLLDAMSETIRPSVLPDNKKLVIYPLIVCLITAGIGIIIGNLIVMVLPLIVLVVFPGLPVFFHLLMYIFVKIELHTHKIVVKDYLGNGIVRSDRMQEMAYADIAYIYYLAKEINLLMNLRNKLKKFKLSPKEIDYTKENLSAKYAVPAEKIKEFEKNSQNILNDYTATAILMKLDNIYSKYKIPKSTAKNISRELKDDEKFNYEYLRDRLRNYPIDIEDLNELKDEFANIKVDIIRPFLLTKVNLAKYKKVAGYRGGLSATAKVDNTLVLANKDGTEKVYCMHFHDLSRQAWQSLMQYIKSHNANITYLMTKNEYKNLLR